MLAGAAAGGAAIGLAATSAWLISRAAEQPVMLTLLAAITAVRAFGISRGVFRYLERVAAHDAAFRVLGELRGTVYARLAALAPAGLAELRSGDLLARLVGDVDGLADCGSASSSRTDRRRWSRSAPSRSWAGWCRRRDSCWRRASW